MLLSTEASICVYGKITKLPEGKVVCIVETTNTIPKFVLQTSMSNTRLIDIYLKCYEIVISCYYNEVSIPFQAPDGHELTVDFWELVGHSPPGGADTILNEVRGS